MWWINSGLHARFDEHFRSLLAMAREENDFDGFLHPATTRTGRR
jgi:hypothetical protein